ncbi:MAG: hypothetical protein AVDCRST_MAG73-794 [uncultured Thermomicrobiales bacterium]|uniref:Uncharacterized protein n=1 Tax=uncultured Thermomicrobiales bacterium TaxID=1645740 RepID=A0A6J4TS80_9BACT|nr:MAG: hypothetical protein AVDCRST_MAG73-794 [uncultured Thermomicrobiales bacterium]
MVGTDPSTTANVGAMLPRLAPYTDERQRRAQNAIEAFREDLDHALAPG